MRFPMHVTLHARRGLRFHRRPEQGIAGEAMQVQRRSDAAESSYQIISPRNLIRSSDPIRAVGPGDFFSRERASVSNLGEPTGDRCREHPMSGLGKRPSRMKTWTPSVGPGRCGLAQCHTYLAQPRVFTHGSPALAANSTSPPASSVQDTCCPQISASHSALTPHHGLQILAEAGVAGHPAPLRASLFLPETHLAQFEISPLTNPRLTPNSPQLPPH